MQTIEDFCSVNFSFPEVLLTTLAETFCMVLEKIFLLSQQKNFSRQGEHTELRRKFSALEKILNPGKNSQLQKISQL